MKTIFSFALCLVFLLYSCENRKECSAYSFGDTKSKVADANKSPGSQNISKDRLLIYSAAITLEVKTPDSIPQQLVAIAGKYKGYVLSSGGLSTTIRVEAASLKPAMKDISLLGTVRNKTISGNDISDEYTDYQIRLENAERARKRYLELLNKANNVEETLKVEKELERLNGEIDLLKGKINRLDHLVEYSTIQVYFNEKVKLGLLGYAFVGSYKAVKWLFIRN